MTDLGGSTTSPVAGGSSGHPPAGGVAAPVAASPNGGVGLLGWMRAGTLPIHPHVDDLTGGVIDYLRTQWGTDHLADTNPHPGYLTPAEGDLAYAPLDPGGGGYLTQTAGDTRYVNTTGDTMTGALTIGGGNLLNLSGAADSIRALQWQTNGVNRWALFAYPTAEGGSNAGGDLYLYRYDDAGGYLGVPLWIHRATGAATFGGAVSAAGNKFQLAANGTLTVTPDPGQPVLVVPASGFASASLASTGHVSVQAANGFGLIPLTDNYNTCGGAANKWIAVYAVAGTINTSSREYKHEAGDLDPETALRAVLATPVRRFAYKGTERVQSGYYEDEADPLFMIGPGEATPSNDAGILLAALQALCTRLGITP